MCFKKLTVMLPMIFFCNTEKHISPLVVSCREPNITRTNKAIRRLILSDDAFRSYVDLEDLRAG